MTELADILPKPADGVTVRRARVIEVQDSSLLVDMGGGITVARLDSCNPVPGQQVYIISEGSSMTAIAAIGGAWRQDTLTVTADATDSVTGLLNGVSTVVTKMGAYTAAVGAVLPLIWSANGHAVWAGATPGAAYVPPAPGAPPTSGGGGATSGTASYAATWGGYSTGSGWHSGALVLPNNLGGFFYGASRFRELQGRTIDAVRVNLQRLSGSGSVSYEAVPNSGPSTISDGGPSGSVGTEGWSGLPPSVASYLIAGSGTGGLVFTGSGTLAGIPSGTLQFDWRV